MSVLDDFGTISTDISQLASGVEPLLVGAGVISPVAQVTPRGTSYSTTISGQKSAPGTLFGLSFSTLFLIAGAALLIVFLFLFLR